MLLARHSHVWQHRFHSLRFRGIDPLDTITSGEKGCAVLEGTCHVCDESLSIEYYDWEGLEHENDGEGGEEFGRVG